MRVKTHGVLARFLAGTVAIALQWGGSCATAVEADEAAQQMLDNLEVGNTDAGALISIKLTAPANYVRHAPFQSGDTVQIWINPAISAVSQDQSPQRQLLRWDATEAVPLYEVAYESAPAGGSRLVVRFRKEVQYRIRQGTDFRSIEIELIKEPGSEVQIGKGMSFNTAVSRLQERSGVKLAGIKSVPHDAPPAEVLEAAKQAMIREDWEGGIGLFTRLLQQPDKAYHQEAQEMLALARERNGQAARAREGYETYLKLYPKGEGAERVQQRLTGLLTAAKAPQEKLKELRIQPDKTFSETYGQFSQYYFRNELFGNSTGNTSTNSLFLSNLDVTSKVRTERFDLRMQFDARYRQNFMSETHNQNDQLRVSNAYVDLVDRVSGLSGRLGRQTRSSGGVLGRFDGGVFNYRFLPKWQATLVSGLPVRAYNSTAPDTDRWFAGGALEWGPFYEYWAGNIYFINQKYLAKTDRRAVGGELRYQHPVHPVFSILDYDVHFDKLNMVHVLGNWNFANGAIATLAADYRKTPFLSTSNALIGAGVESINDLLFCQDQSVTKVADENTSTMKSVSLGGITPVADKLQFNGDITVTHQTGSTATYKIDNACGKVKYQGMGLQESYAAQLIASSVFTEGDVWNFGLRYTDQQTSADFLSGFIDGRFPINSDLRLDPRIRVDYITGFKGADAVRLRPAMRVNYRLISKVFVEFETGLEYRTKAAFEPDDTVGYYVSAGYRWDF